MIVEKENVLEAGLSIIKLIKDSRLRRNMGKNRRQRVKDQFDWEANLEEMEKVYNRLAWEDKNINEEKS